MENDQERVNLIAACNCLQGSLLLKDNPQDVAENLALLYVAIGDFIDTGYVAYEDIDSELLKIQEGAYNGRTGS